MDKLIPLEIPPGVYRNGTDYESKGRWFDANLIRFIDKTVKPIGGWRRAQDDAGANITALTGVPRGALAWRGPTGNPYVAVGTTSKLYSLSGGALNDITPAGYTVGRVDTGYGSASSGAYGSGNYGVGAYGYGQITNALLEADTWHLDNFGDYLVGVDTKNLKLYLWNGSGVATSVDFSAATGAPTTVTGVVVTPERFLVLLGTGGNLRRLTWASQQTSSVWNPLITNTAGGWDLASQGRIMAARKTISETLIWTDVDVHSMIYIGGPLLYRFKQIADKCGAISKRAVVTVGSTAFWMSKKGFFMYNGNVSEMPSDVRDYVFNDMNVTQSAKVWATSISEHGEVRWYYCSAGSVEIDRYVTYNYREQHWSIGKLARTAGVDSGAIVYPVELTFDGLMYEHEVANDRSGAPAAYAESGPAELGEGDNTFLVQKIVPDEKMLGDVAVTFYTRQYPNGVETVSGPYTLAEPQPIAVRLRARQARVRLQEVRAVDWRVGQFRFGLVPSSRR